MIVSLQLPYGKVRHAYLMIIVSFFITIITNLLPSGQQVITSVPTCTCKCSNSALIGVSAVLILLVDILTIIIIIQCLVMARMTNPSNVTWRNKCATNPTTIQRDVPIVPKKAYATIQSDIPVAPDEAYATIQSDIPVAPDETYATIQSDIPVAPDETYASIQSDVPVAPNEAYATMQSDVPVAPNKAYATTQSNVPAIPSKAYPLHKITNTSEE